MSIVRQTEGGVLRVKQSVRTLLSVCRTAFGLGLLVYLGVSGVINWSTLFGLLKAWPIALIALALLLIDMGVTSARLCLLLKPHDLHLTWLSSLRLTLIGTFFNICLPGATGGDVVRIYYATANNPGRRTEVATVMVLDRMIGMFALAVVPLIIAPLFPQLVETVAVLPILLWAGASIASVMATGMLVCSIPRLRYSRLVVWGLQTLPLGHQIERIFDTVHVYRRHLGTMLVSVAMSLLVHLIMIAVVLLVVQATNPDGISWYMALLIPLGFMANSLPLTPGGLGVGEAAFDKLFQLVSLSGGAEALLGWRMLMMLIGMSGLVFYLRGGGQFIHRRVPPGKDWRGDMLCDAETMLEGV